MLLYLLSAAVLSPNVAALMLGASDPVHNDFAAPVTHGGQETREVVAEKEVRSPAAIKRYSVVSMRFSAGRLLIQTEGRALSQGSLGEKIRVINLQSKTVVTGIVVGESQVDIR